MNESIRQWNERLAELKEQGRLHRKYEVRRAELLEEQTRLEAEAERWRQRLEREQKDVDRLKGVSFASLFYSLTGQKEERLEAEQVEVLEAKLRYDGVIAELAGVKEQLGRAEADLQELASWQYEYERLYREKEHALLEEDAELRELAGTIAELNGQIKELDEAQLAGETVASHLRQAEAKLQSAKSWGTYDMLGGGMISTHIKRGHIDEAADYIHQAERSMATFSRELADVGGALEQGMDAKRFLRFTDYFFDNFITDWMVQGKIADTLQEVKRRSEQVLEIVGKLDLRRKRLEQERDRSLNVYRQKVELG